MNFFKELEKTAGYTARPGLRREPPILLAEQIPNNGTGKHDSLIASE